MTVTKTKKETNVAELPTFACPICGQQVKNYFVDIPPLFTLYKKLRSPIPAVVKCPVGHNLIAHLYFAENELKIAQVDVAFVPSPYKIIRRTISDIDGFSDNIKFIALFWHNRKSNDLLYLSTGNTFFDVFLINLYSSLFDSVTDKIEFFNSVSVNITCYFVVYSCKAYTIGFSLCIKGSQDTLVRIMKKNSTNESLKSLFNSFRRVRSLKTAEKKLFSFLDKFVNGPAGI